MEENKQQDMLLNSSGDGRWMLILLVVLIGSFMAILDSSIVNVAIPSMMNDFQTTTSRIQWVVTIYMLALGVVVPTSGWMGDYFGYKRLYIYSLAVFTIGSALCSLAWSEQILIVARVIQALGGGMIMPTTMSMIFSIVPRDKMGSANGIFGLTMIVAPAIGPTLGGYLVQYINWRWIFTINLPVGIIGVFLAATLLPEFPRHPAGKFDLWGFLTSSSGLFCLLLALSQGQDWGWRSLPIVMLLYFSFALLGIFVFHQLTTPEPLLDLRVFKYPAFTVGNLMIVIITIGMFGALFYVPLFLQSVRGMGALQAGLLMLPPALASGIALPVAGKLYDKFGPRIPVSIGILLIAYGTYLLTKIDLETPVHTIIVWNVIRSLGMGLTMMPIQTSIMTVLPQRQIGRGSSITNIINRVAGSFGLAILTLMLNDRLAANSAYLTWSVSQDNLGGLLASGVVSKDTALGLLQANIAKVSFVQSINNLFFITSLLTLMALFFTFLLKKGDSGQKTANA